jgi:hypothetical protein
MNDIELSDIKFLLSLVDYLDIAEVPSGLCPTFYITCTEAGDKELADRIKGLKLKYGIERKPKEYE